ncbi:MAG: DUF296 domain-containing protein, partial [Clostridiales bacterium]|nr:DUF296 domain-containing protein [Clostridiales bacterium]
NYIIRLNKGEEILETISALCEKENIKAGFVTGLGAANDIEIGIFDTVKKEYFKRSYKGDYEIAALVGNISRQNGAPYLHFHITIGNPQTEKYAAGHLSKCVISATGEIYLTAVDADVDREMSEEIGLNLMKFYITSGDGKMAKIAVLLPKEFMKEQAEKVIKRNNFNIHSLKVIQSVDAIAEARDAVTNGADIIVSRGYQAKLIQENTNIPVAEMKVSVQDVGLLINKAKALTNKEEPKIAVVSFRNMMEDISCFSELFNIQLYVHYMNDFEDIEDILKELIEEEIDVVLEGKQ